MAMSWGHPCTRCHTDSPLTSVSTQLVDVCRMQHVPVSSLIRHKYQDVYLFRHLRYAFSKRNYVYREIDRSILQSNKVMNAIECEGGSSEDVRRAINKAKQHYVNMKAAISNVVIKCVGYVCMKVMKRLFGSILSVPEQMENLQRMHNTGLPIIYMPTHTSHVDYVLVTWLLFHYNLRVPHVASGDNLNLSGFGWLLRCLGGFFIRRKLEDKGAPKDDLYRAVLQSYIDGILSQHYDLEFFPEGGRSRFGKVCRPKTGIMSVLVQACNSGVVRDVWLVPVSISYERLLEGIFVGELEGRPKQRESVWQMFVSAYKAINQSHGHARIDFGKPVSLMKYLDSMRICPPRPMSSPQILCSPSTVILETMGMFARVGPQTTSANCIEKDTIKALCDHIVFDCVSNGCVTVPELLACVLLSGVRSCRSVEDVVEDVTWLYHFTNRPLIHYSNNLNQHNILDAAKLIGEDIIVVEYQFGDSDSGIEETHNIEDRPPARIRPSKHRGNVLQLAYYRNSGMQFIAIDCIIACAFLSLWNNAEMGSKILKTDLIDLATSLEDILSFEFISVPPCHTVEEVVKAKLNGTGFYFTSGENHQFVELIHDSDIDRISMLKSLLDPLLYCYMITARIISQLPNQGIKERDFVFKMLNQEDAMDFGNIKISDVPIESLNKNSITNAIYFMIRMRQITKDDTSGTLRLNHTSNAMLALDIMQQTIAKLL